MLSIAIAAALASCQKDTEPTTTNNPSTTFAVSASVQNTLSVTQSEFTDGDAISIWAWAGETAVVNGVVNTFDGTSWSPASPMLWLDMTTVHNFMATSPVQTVTDFDAHAYTLSGNGAADDDFLVAVNTTDDLNATNYTTVAPPFEHMMSKVTISLSFRDQFGTTAPTVSKVTIVAKNNASIDLMNQTTTATGSTTDFQIKETSDNTNYEGVIVPQEIQYIDILIGEDTYRYTHSSEFTLVQGMNHNISLTVGKNLIVLDTDEITISPWEPGSSITDGDAEIVTNN